MDRQHPDYDESYPGLHFDTGGVVLYKHGFKNNENGGWDMRQQEIDDPSDGRIFRGGYLYGYESEEGRTQDVYDYLQNVLSYPEDNNIEVSLLYKRDQKLNDLGI